MKDEFERTAALLLEELPAILGQGSVETATSGACMGRAEAVLGTIGFGGAEMRGSLSLVADPNVWRAIEPAGFAADTLTDAQVCDMVGELCNMLAGGFKRRLIRFGVDIVCGLPTSAYGRLTLPELPRTAALHVGAYRVRTAGGHIELRADVLFRDGFVFPTDTLLGVEPAATELFF